MDRVNHARAALNLNHHRRKLSQLSVSFLSHYRLISQYVGTRSMFGYDNPQVSTRLQMAGVFVTLTTRRRLNTPRSSYAGR